MKPNQKSDIWGSPGPVVKTLPSDAGGTGLIPDRGAEISMPRGQKTKT